MIIGSESVVCPNLPKRFIRENARACDEMAALSNRVRRYLPYAFIAAGVAWLAIIATGASFLLLWPAALSILSGIILKWKPGGRLSSALSRATALYGIVLAAYQVYVALPLLVGIFATIAALSVVSFLVLAVYNVVLLYGSIPKPAEE